MTVELLMAGLLAAAAQSQPPAQPAPTLLQGDRLIVTDDRQSIRGRIADLTDDMLVLDRDNNPLRIPLTTIRQIDRTGDSLFNGSAIGAGIGGATALAAMGIACGNSGCADTSTSLDPRLTLLGTLIGAGIGAMVDAAIERRQTMYTAGAPKPLLAPRARAGETTRRGAARFAPTVFGRFGWARLTDDEGWLGDGATVGFGAIVPITTRLGLQVAYDRHKHRRDFEPVGPPGTPARGGFTGTEQLVTAKALFFFRPDQRVRPYAGIGIGFLDSTRVSEFPTFVNQPGGFPVPGPPEIFRYDFRGGGIGFAAGLDVRVTGRLSILGDLTLDLAGREALGSNRLTAGAGWRF
jgi:Outer membrane protein beta-barrel domain